MSGSSCVPRVCACLPTSTCVTPPLHQRRLAAPQALPCLQHILLGPGASQAMATQWPPCQWSRWAQTTSGGSSCPCPEQPPGEATSVPRPEPQKPTWACCSPSPGPGGGLARLGVDAYHSSLSFLFLFLLKMFSLRQLVDNIKCKFHVYNAMAHGFYRSHPLQSF